ncbi:spermidine/putrescine transport system substrate-binding protein [Peteryoungia aggregata LMG 23059]|uniref:Spermidine/putrescine transport system substrate-binding protein n=1 Tax=Peteryoungia aggregata LMG 23059 TaxID=1368425 RepID=A0ABU0G7D0_9HYPH|nr:spermidine/putrescine ABC transporter substrate-binding protein [Peteryoungia aggregata]MDQ0421248.1 spermidine/putrescine transport system substrate-binding protein [Peteryoungia aggregata LMG 23059]
MVKQTKTPDITAQRFVAEFMRLKRGSVTRRHFLAVTGLGAAALLFGGARRTSVATSESAPLGKKVSLATWPNYHDPQTFEDFTARYGVEVDVSIIGSNEGTFKALESGRDWDIIVPTQYAIAPYVQRGMLIPLDLRQLPNFDLRAHSDRFLRPGVKAGAFYAVPKNAGTSGIAYNTRHLDPVTSWRGFFDRAMAEASGRTIVHDYQLTAIGGALVALGHRFNSLDTTELARAEELLMQVRPHLQAIDSDYQPAMRTGEAWMTMCWSNDASQMHRDVPEIAYEIATDGGEIWTDYYAIPTSARNRPAAHALINHLLHPDIAAREHLVHGGTVTDKRVRALLPEEILADDIIHPGKAKLTALEFGLAVVMTDPTRAEIMNRFRAARG